MADDDQRLEAALRDGFAQQLGQLEIPSGMGRRGRTIARRRSARRAGIVAVPALVVAVVAVLLLSGPRSHAPRLISARQVIREVSAQVAQVSRAGGVLETISSSADRGIPRMREWEYTDLRNGITYDLMRYTNARGALVTLYWNRARQRDDGRITNTALEIFGHERTWTVERGVTGAPRPSPSVQSTARQIAHALAQGHVTLRGPATIDGNPALHLQLPSPTPDARYELYVDPHSYRPIQELVRATSHGHTVTSRIYLRPATASNIAQAARRPVIPTGFRYFKTRSLPPRYPTYRHKR